MGKTATAMPGVVPAFHGVATLATRDQSRAGHLRHSFRIECQPHSRPRLGLQFNPVQEYFPFESLQRVCHQRKAAGRIIPYTGPTFGSQYPQFISCYPRLHTSQENHCAQKNWLGLTLDAPTESDFRQRHQHLKKLATEEIGRHFDGRDSPHANEP